ncbi:MAG: hypothetical protein R6X34_04325, partial [Chloroflexota bacterium]
MTQPVSSEPASDPLAVSAAKGREAWRRFGLRLSAVTPSQVARLLVAAGVMAAIGWLAWTARVALLPFVIGAGLAYIMLPTV